MARMSTLAEDERAEIEDAMALLGRAEVLLNAQVRLRLRQAVQRGHGDLLSPALGQLDDIERAVLHAQALLSKFWRAGNAAGWHTATPPARQKRSAAE